MGEGDGAPTPNARRRRGRPALPLEPGTGVAQEDTGQWWTADERPITRRHVLNLSFAEHATGVLGRDETVPALESKGTDEREVLVDRFLALERFYHCAGTAVLAELGRHGSDAQICASADALMAAFDAGEVRTQTDALRWLRRRRLGCAPQTMHQKDHLAHILHAAVSAYRQRYPDAPPQEILDPIARLWHHYHRLLSAEADKEK